MASTNTRVETPRGFKNAAPRLFSKARRYISKKISQTRTRLTISEDIFSAKTPETHLPDAHNTLDGDVSNTMSLIMDSQKVIVSKLLAASRAELESLPHDSAKNAVECLQRELDSPSFTGDRDRRRRHLSCLRQLVHLHGIVPSSLSVSDVKMETTRFSGGGFSDVHRGDLNGISVAVKVLRIFADTKDRERILTQCRKEAILWRQLRHENILEFLGTSNLEDGTIGLISPLMENGDVMSFLRGRPKFDRLQCVIDVAEGLKFLHSQDPPIVHADIRGGNILVKGNSRCCIADFGLSIYLESTFSEDQSNTFSVKGTWRWLPPEAMDEDNDANYKYLPSRDIYSFGCTIIEIFTGSVPFPALKERQVILEVMQGRSPPIPTSVTVHERTAQLWGYIVPRCLLANPSERLTISNVAAFLRQLPPPEAKPTILSARRRSSFWSIPEEPMTAKPAPRVELNPLILEDVAEHLQLELDSPGLTGYRRRLFIRDLRQLVDQDGIVPSSLYRSVRMEPTRFSGSRFSNVYRGDSDGVCVAVKILRILENTNDHGRTLKECRKEAILWRQLKHENILEFLGIVQREDSTLGLVSPLMKNGDSMSFLRKHPEFDRLKCVIDIAEGLKYLHSHDPPIIHADIQGENVLVKDNLRCCLCGFGQSVFADAIFSEDRSSPARVKGTWRRLPPEAVDEDNDANYKYLPSRDIYSFGCTIIEIFTGSVPFPALMEHQVILEVMQGHPLPMPKDMPGPKELWDDLVPRCLTRNPLDRPTIHEVAAFLRGLRPESGTGELE